MPLAEESVLQPAYGFEYALEYTVLAVTAVQYGNDYVEFCPYIVPEKGSFFTV